MIRHVVAAVLRCLGVTRSAAGGTLPPRRYDTESIPVRLSPGRRVTDPDDAEALGLTVYRQEWRP